MQIETVAEPDCFVKCSQWATLTLITWFGAESVNGWWFFCVSTNSFVLRERLQLFPFDLPSSSPHLIWHPSAIYSLALCCSLWECFLLLLPLLLRRRRLHLPLTPPTLEMFQQLPLQPLSWQDAAPSRQFSSNLVSRKLVIWALWNCTAIVQWNTHLDLVQWVKRQRDWMLWWDARDDVICQMDQYGLVALVDLFIDPFASNMSHVSCSTLWPPALN